MQAGLAGSTAMLVALLGAVLRLEIPLNRYEIAELARRIEFDLMGVTCGFQDQYMAAFGGLNYLDFRDKGPGWRTIPSSRRWRAWRRSSPPPLVLGNTGVRAAPARAPEPAGALAGRRAGDRRLRAHRRLAREAKKALLAATGPAWARR